MVKLVVAGVGPGGADYILPVAWQKASEADILVGGERALAPFAGLGKETWPVTADLPALAAAIKKQLPARRITVLVSGDPGFYSLLGFLRRNFSDSELEVYPGISSVQVAFSRLGESWQDAVLLSAHGRDPAVLLPRLLTPGKKAILTDKLWTPDRLASLMLDAGCADAGVTLCYRLTLPDELIETTSLRQLTSAVEGDCVMVIHHE
jgi:cobalt-precorrin-7 (C5)-methyltransferase